MGIAAPPPAGTRWSAAGPLLKTMTPSRFHAPPRALVLGASAQIVSGGPPATATFIRLPPAE